jgi:hypothetical protein
MSLTRSARALPARAALARAALAAAALLLCQLSPVQAQPGGEPPHAKGETIVAAFELADCIQYALQNQPRIAAMRASQAAGEDGSRALDNLKFAAVVDPEIPIRRRQATLGVAAAGAAIEQAERETIYAVTRTYFTVLYSREQERVARGVVSRLTGLYETAKKQLDAGAADITSTDVNRAKVYLQLAKTKQLQAAGGTKRAMAALREAMGAPCDLAFEVPARGLPLVEAKLTREDVIAVAIARRPEMARAALFADIVCLEVDAQNHCTLKKKETFAAGADIHGLQVPPGSQNSEYRPGAVPPEMPTMLVGSRSERMRHAQSLYMRARAVVDVTKNLIALDAEDAFLRWEEAGAELAEARLAAEVGEQMADDLNKDFAAKAKVKVDEVINAHVLAAQARAQYNEFLYKHVLALADIERVTAGAFNPGWLAPRKQ